MTKANMQQENDYARKFRSRRAQEQLQNERQYVMCGAGFGMRQVSTAR